MRKEFTFEPTKKDDDDEPFSDMDIDFNKIDVKNLSDEEKFSLVDYFANKIKKRLTKEEKKALKEEVEKLEKKGETQIAGFELFAICNYWATQNGFPMIRNPEQFLELAILHPELFED